MSTTLRNRKGTPDKHNLPTSASTTFTVARAVWAVRTAFLTSVILLSFLSLIVVLNNTVGFGRRGHSTNLLDKLAAAVGLQEHAYTVVIDAGSTGSRVLAFAFHRSVADRSVKLDYEYYADTKPGLSSFADEPEKAAESIAGLLSKAKEVIPKALWASTPLVLKATAGLRLLPAEKADTILDHVRQVFEESGFLVTSKSVSIMDGIDEGLFSWFTINFLLDRLGSDPHNTVAALDLGGGSNQITFAPKDTQTIHGAPQGFLHQVSALQQNIDVYSYSYLGLGLMAARKHILSHNNPESETLLRSPCINPLVRRGWTYNGSTFIVTGSHDVDVDKIPLEQWQKKGGVPKADYDQCLAIVRKIVETSVHKPHELNTREVVAISYYYDRAIDHGLIDAATGGSVSVEKLFKTAKELCTIPNPDQAFACLDMTYIASLLHHGFGMRPDTVVQLRKKIDGYETSWALGAAFHVLHNGI